jgi:hypothetical protein
LSATLNRNSRVAQRESFDGMFGVPAEREGGLEEEALLPGRFTPVQRADAEPGENWNGHSVELGDAWTLPRRATIRLAACSSVTPLAGSCD